MHLSQQVKEYQLSSALFLPDSEWESRDIVEGSKLSSKSNFQKRADVISESKDVILCGRLLSELFLCARFLPENTQVRIQTILNDANFVLIADPAFQYKLEVTKAKLCLSRYKLTNDALLRQHRTLNGRNGLLYNFPRTETRVLTVAAGHYGINMEVSQFLKNFKYFYELFRSRADESPIA